VFLRNVDLFQQATRRCVLEDRTLVFVQLVAREAVNFVRESGT
jgi:hypothetical protein